MKILVYGAGVLGCQLAHMLIKAGNDVTVLARGEWKKTIEQKGIVIRHCAQFKTTVDKVKVIDTLLTGDIYDLTFVVMQYTQINAVLPIIGANKSKYVVFVGNNPNAEVTQKSLKQIDPNKEIAFGFQGTAGRREKGRVVSIHAGVGMTLGALKGKISDDFRSCIERALAGVKYRLKWETEMDAWLKCHLVLILPVCYVCYAVGCRLPKATKEQRKAILDAALEGCTLLQDMNISIRVEDSVDYFKPGKKRKKMEHMIFLMAKTPIGKLVASDHCKKAVSEMQGLDEAFEEFRKRTGTPMPVWEKLRANGKPEELKG